ncbi:RusA family crossover junction endodeoxyribonuclease [Weissella sp. MSCH1]|uniref:RusA family crossover junction endodeoxyribonuclease n=1 Tax=Weissella sp. MSCH1 TaxID=3383343 RepID=UPI0038969A88
MNELFNSLAKFLKREFGQLNDKLDSLKGNSDQVGSVKIFDALIELDNEFASGNMMGQNGQRKFRPKGYHDYQDEVVAALDDINDKVKLSIDPDDALAVSLVFYQTRIKQTTRSTKDLDNMEKPTLDAMQKALGFDDAQIVDKRSRKMMHFTRALRIEIWRM